MAGPVLAAFLVLLFVSCDQGPGTAPKEEQCRAVAGDVIQPLAKGNYWQKVKHAVPESTVIDTIRSSIEGVLPVNVNDNTYNAYKRKRNGGFERLFWNGPKGLYTLGMIASNDTMRIEPKLKYKYPVSVGEEWHTLNIQWDKFNGVTIRDTLTYEAVKTGEKFITQLDTFDTVVYHWYAQQALPDVSSYWHIFEYYAPGIGHVGTRLYSHEDTSYSYGDREEMDLRTETELIDYCLK